MIRILPHPKSAAMSAEPSQFVVVKGAPESMVSVCQPNSIPSSFEVSLNHKTCQGYRVLAAGVAPLKKDLETRIASISRKEVRFELNACI